MTTTEVAPLPAVIEEEDHRGIERFSIGAHPTDTGPTLDATTERVRSDYVEKEWMQFIGPIALCVARRMDNILATEASQGVTVKSWSKEMGITPEQFVEALNRLDRFALGEWQGRANFMLRRHWPKPVPLAITTPRHRDVLLALSDE